MANQVHLSIAAINQRDGSCRLVRQREPVFAGPGSDAVAAVMFGGDQLVIGSEFATEPALLAGAAA
jgi:hypothetical protein